MTNSAKQALLWVVVTLVLLVSIFPFYWMIKTALSPQDEVFDLSMFPNTIDFSSFGRAWTEGGLGASMATGAFVTLMILVLQLGTGIPAAYVLSKVHSKWTALVLSVVLASLLIPAQATLIPTFIGINLFGFANTMTGLILPFITSAFGIYLMRQQMVSIPDTLMEAARTDGLGHVRTLTTVILPLAMPGIAAFTVFSVFSHWNEYLWPLLIARSPELRTPPLALAVFQNADAGFDYAALSAGAIFVTAPVVVLFLFCQRQFIQGMAGSEIPG